MKRTVNRFPDESVMGSELWVQSYGFRVMEGSSWFLVFGSWLRGIGPVPDGPRVLIEGPLKKLDNRNFPPYICNQLLILLLKFLIMVISCVNFNQTGTST